MVLFNDETGGSSLKIIVLFSYVEDSIRNAQEFISLLLSGFGDKYGLGLFLFDQLGPTLGIICRCTLELEDDGEGLSRSDLWLKLMDRVNR